MDSGRQLQVCSRCQTSILATKASQRFNVSTIAHIPTIMTKTTPGARKKAGIGMGMSLEAAGAEKARESAAMAQERAALLEKEAAQACAREALLRRQLLEVQCQGRKAPF